MPVLKALLFLLVLLLCSCSNGETSTNSSDDAPATDKQSLEKSARDTSLEEHTDEIKKMEKESRSQNPSHFSDHIMTKSPDGQSGGESDPLKKREMTTKGGGR